MGPTGISPLGAILICIAIGLAIGLTAKWQTAKSWPRFIIESVTATIAAFLVAFSDALFGISISTAWGTLIGMVAAAAVAVLCFRLMGRNLQ